MYLWVKMHKTPIEQSSFNLNWGIVMQRLIVKDQALSFDCQRKESINLRKKFLNKPLGKCFGLIADSCGLSMTAHAMPI